MKDNEHYNIIYSYPTRYIITLRGLDSYKTWQFHNYGHPKRTSQNSRGVIIDIRELMRSKMGLLRKMYNQNKLYKNQ